MKKTVIAMILFSLIMVGTLTFVGFKFQDSIKEYRNLEGDIEESGQFYVELKDLKLKVGETYRVNLKTLLEEKMLKTLEVGEDLCDGYLIIKKNISDYDYNAYIKCEEYTTVDYE